METMNERRANIAAMTYGEIGIIKNRMLTEVDKHPECPFCKKKMFRTLKPYPEPHVVWQCNGYLKNEGNAWWANDQPCGLVVGMDGVIDFGFGKEYLK